MSQILNSVSRRKHCIPRPKSEVDRKTSFTARFAITLNYVINMEETFLSPSNNVRYYLTEPYCQDYREIREILILIIINIKSFTLLNIIE